MIESLNDLLDAGELPFYTPVAVYGAPTDTVNVDSVKLVVDDYEVLHRQLTCWCLIQRFWYYVLVKPQVSDAEYDAIEACVRSIENNLEIGVDNKYSPCIMPGSNRWQDYPRSIIGFFASSQAFRRLIGWRKYNPHRRTDSQSK